MSLDIDDEILKEDTEIKKLGVKRSFKHVENTKVRSAKSKTPTPDITDASLPLSGLTIVISG